MKKILYTLSMLALLAGSIVSIQSCSQSSAKSQEAEKNTIPLLLERKATLGTDEETNRIKTTYDNCVIALKNNPEDYKSYLTLATVYISEGRITGDLAYYNEAAMQVLEHVINAHQQNKEYEFEAYNYEAAVLLSMHQFEEAEQVAWKALVLSRKNSGLYGALIDANVELGRYDAAVKYCDTMINMKPDIRSYSRVSYLRQIYGDNRGAIDAMQFAVSAGAPGAENTEWARVTLADLYLSIGVLDTAEMLYKESLVRRPEYVYAEMGLAKIDKAKKNYDEAITHCENAIRTISESSFVSALADMYYLKGDEMKAKEVYADVLKLLEQSEKEQNKSDAKVKHNGARELATASMKAGKLDEALRYAKTDLVMRPDNIDANELIAWIYYLQGDYNSAKMHADKMLITDIKNANSLYKAGLIYKKAGDAEKGNALMKQAETISPYIDALIIKAS